jgi:hypothetical protein
MSILEKIIGAESGGNPNARNPNSSATGAGQFLSGTWLDMMSRYRPDLTAGQSPDAILAMRTDPALSREMTARYADQNNQTLTNAGIPVTPGNTYLAHFAGPQGAVKVLQADPSTPAGDILGAAVVKANPFLASMTAGDLAAWAGRKMGARGGQPAAQPLPASPVAPAQGVPAMPLAVASSEPPLQVQQQPQGLAPDMPMQFQEPPAMQAQQIFAPPRKPPDLRALRAALTRPSSAGLFFGRG